MESESFRKRAVHYQSRRQKGPRIRGCENREKSPDCRDGQKTYKFSKDEEALGHLIISIARGKAGNETNLT